MGRATVLIVDDDRDIVELLEEALWLEGYRVLSAVDWEALRLAHEQRPDVILLDLLMPGLDGEEVARRLRADQATRDIPIVVMSAHDRRLMSATKLPVDDQLLKPFHLDHLFETVGRWAKPA